MKRSSASTRSLRCLSWCLEVLSSSKCVFQTKSIIILIWYNNNDENKNNFNNFKLHQNLSSELESPDNLHQVWRVPVTPQASAQIIYQPCQVTTSHGPRIPRIWTPSGRSLNVLPHGHVAPPGDPSCKDILRAELTHLSRTNASWPKITETYFSVPVFSVKVLARLFWPWWLKSRMWGGDSQHIGVWSFSESLHYA